MAHALRISAIKKQEKTWSITYSDRPQTWLVYKRCLCKICSYCQYWLMLFVLWRWFPEVQNIYYQGNKRKQVPSNQNAKRLESFFNAAAVLMTNQLQMLALNSIDDFTKLFCPPAVSYMTVYSLLFLITFEFLQRCQPLEFWNLEMFSSVQCVPAGSLDHSSSCNPPTHPTWNDKFWVNAILKIYTFVRAAL